jgi:hypothetical protein
MGARSNRAAFCAVIQSDNPIPHGCPKVSESDTKHKLIEFCLQKQVEKKPVIVQDAIDFMTEHRTRVDRMGLTLEFGSTTEPEAWPG